MIFIAKCIDGNFNFFVLLFELIEQFYLCQWQYMFKMSFMLFSCYSSSQHIPCMWWNTRFCQPTITGRFFDIFCKSIYVGLSRNNCPTRKFIICNLNFLCLCNVFLEVPIVFSICRVKRYFIFLDETTVVCIALRAIQTSYFRDFSKSFNTLVILLKTFCFTFVYFVEFWIPNCWKVNKKHVSNLVFP